MASALTSNSQLDAKLRFSFPGIDLNLLKAILASVVWDWYDLHLNDTLIKRKILFFYVTLQVKHALPLLEALVGPRTFTTSF